MMGLTVDFSETVTKYTPDRERIWGTIGELKLLIMLSYVMRVTVDPLTASSSRLTISLTYAPPRSISGDPISALVGDWYGQRCLGNMCQDTRSAMAVLAPRRPEKRRPDLGTVDKFLNRKCPILGIPISDVGS